MNASRKKGDDLANINFDAAYRDTPEGVHSAVLKSFGSIKNGKRQSGAPAYFRHSMAVGVILIGSGILAFFLIRRMNTSAVDLVVSARDENAIHVFASRIDDSYHAAKDCSYARGNLVELPIFTAKNLEKQPCSFCVAADGGHTQ